MGKPNNSDPFIALRATAACHCMSVSLKR